MSLRIFLALLAVGLSRWTTGRGDAATEPAAAPPAPRPPTRTTDAGRRGKPTNTETQGAHVVASPDPQVGGADSTYEAPARPKVTKVQPGKSVKARPKAKSPGGASKKKTAAKKPPPNYGGSE